MYINATSMKNQFSFFSAHPPANIKYLYSFAEGDVKTDVILTESVVRSINDTSHSIFVLLLHFLWRKLCLQIRFWSHTSSSSCCPGSKPQRQADCYFMTVFTCWSVFCTKDMNQISFLHVCLFWMCVTTSLMIQCLLYKDYRPQQWLSSRQFLQSLGVTILFGS